MYKSCKCWMCCTFTLLEVESLQCSVVTALCLCLWLLLRFRHKQHSVGVKKTSLGQWWLASMTNRSLTQPWPSLIATFTVKSDTSCPTCYPPVSFTHSALDEVDSFHIWLVFECSHTVRHWNGSSEDTKWCDVPCSPPRTVMNKGQSVAHFFIGVTHNTFIHWLKISMQALKSTLTESSSCRSGSVTVTSFLPICPHSVMRTGARSKKTRLTWCRWMVTWDDKSGVWQNTKGKSGEVTQQTAFSSGEYQSKWCCR